MSCEMMSISSPQTSSRAVYADDATSDERAHVTNERIQPSVEGSVSVLARARRVENKLCSRPLSISLSLSLSLSRGVRLSLSFDQKSSRTSGRQHIWVQKVFANTLRLAARFGSVAFCSIPSVEGVIANAGSLQAADARRNLAVRTWVAAHVLRRERRRPVHLPHSRESRPMVPPPASSSKGFFALIFSRVCPS